YFDSLDLHSFPTRRSSDLGFWDRYDAVACGHGAFHREHVARRYQLHHHHHQPAHAWHVVFKTATDNLVIPFYGYCRAAILPGFVRSGVVADIRPQLRNELLPV